MKILQLLQGLNPGCSAQHRPESDVPIDLALSSSYRRLPQSPVMLGSHCTSPGDADGGKHVNCQLYLIETSDLVRFLGIHMDCYLKWT